MKIVYGKELSYEQESVVKDIAIQCGVLYDTARLLFYREQDTVEKAKRFLTPGEAGLHDPLLLSGMVDAIRRISQAKDRNEKVLIFGDYDADGVCASSVLYYSLLEYGIRNLRVFVPEREQGYGLNVDTVLAFNDDQKVDLVITVDCGVSDCDKIDELIKAGIDVIVTDHHEPPIILPNCTTINPKLSGQAYPFNGLCGAGVAYKLANALIGNRANKYLDLVAVATVADSMDLVDENRDIVHLGLKLINNNYTQRLAFKYLLGDNVKEVTAQTIAYAVAPKINAGGRMGDAKTALNLFVASDPNSVFDLAVKLNAYNVARQTECDKIYNESKAIIKKYSLNKRKIIMVKNKEWNAGFVGVVAAKLAEEFARPVIVFAGQGDNLKGSARSIDGINIYDAVASAKDLTISYGGHAQAAGIGVSEQNFLAFERAVEDYININYAKIKYEQKVYADWDMQAEISLQFAREIELLEPYGVGNRRPTFTLSAKSINSQPLRNGSAHYTFNTNVIEMLDFNGQSHVSILNLPLDKKLLFEVNLSTFRGRQSIKGYLRAISCDYSDLSAVKTHIFVNELRKLVTQNGQTNEVENYNFNDQSGTLYVLSDASNLSLFPQVSEMPLYLFNITVKNYNDCVVVSPVEIPEGYDKVVYLDRPLKAMSGEHDSQLISNVCGYSFIDELTTERSEFVRLYNKLCSLKNKSFISTASFSERHCKGENPLQLAFVMEVFMELGIFEVKNGVFTHNEKIKNALTNSALYSKIDLIKA